MLGLSNILKVLWKFSLEIYFREKRKKVYLRHKKSRPGHDLPMSVNESFGNFARILFSRNFPYAKFCEYKTLAEISKFKLQ